MMRDFIVNPTFFAAYALGVIVVIIFGRHSRVQPIATMIILTIPGALHVAAFILWVDDVRFMMQDTQTIPVMLLLRLISGLFILPWIIIVAVFFALNANRRWLHYICPNNIWVGRTYILATAVACLYFIEAVYIVYVVHSLDHV
jgi:hypothetical protein